MLNEIVVKSLIAGILACLACGLGALPLLIRRIDPSKHTGIGFAFAGGLMFSASVYNLILPSLQMEQTTLTLPRVSGVVGGILLGAAFMWFTNRFLSHDESHEEQWQKWGGRTGLLIFIAMCIHSIPEGVAVGVGYASGEVYQTRLGSYIALAIALHNIPEGLAVSIPLRSAGASIHRCFWAAVLTSLPQPIAAVPASILAWFFQPLMPGLMSFAAGAMIFLVLLEMIPEALDTERPIVIAWSFVLGFCLMLMVQVLLP